MQRTITFRKDREICDETKANRKETIKQTFRTISRHGFLFLT